MKTKDFTKDEQGVAFPMAMIVMAILSALMVAFAVLATSEPQIASNQMASAQARGLAEAGLERALWALTKGDSDPAASGALVLDASKNLPSPMPAPYDGAALVSVSSAGGFKVTVTEKTPPVPNQKVVTAVGFVPNATNPIAVKKVTAVVTRLSWINPICGLCAGGENPPGLTSNVQVGGNATVNASTSSQGSGGTAVGAGAFCAGVTPTAAVASNGTVNTNGNPSLYAPPGGSGTANGASFPNTMLLSDSDIATIKALAKARGTYYQPSSPGGTVTWTSPPPNGIIFVDTYSGNPFTNSSPSSDTSSPLVDLHGNWGSTWSGWLIVAGSIDISGNVSMNGLIYSQNDIALHGTGNGAISGAVISTNRKDANSTLVDVEDIGNNPLIYDCPKVRDGGGQLSQNWFVSPGTYREISGQ